MGIVVILILISLTMAVIFLAIFFWNMKSGQYDDTYTPSVRMLFEDEKKTDEEKKLANNTTCCDGIDRPPQTAPS